MRGNMNLAEFGARYLAGQGEVDLGLGHGRVAGAATNVYARVSSLAESPTGAKGGIDLLKAGIGSVGMTEETTTHVKDW